MRVDSLVIICVLCDQDHLDVETKAAGKALFERYSRPTDFGRSHVMAGNSIALYHVRCNLNANKEAVSQEWGDPDRADRISGVDQGGGADGKTLGVYLLVHSGGVDLEGFHPKKVAGLLTALRLTKVTKLCLIACKGALGGEAVAPGQEGQGRPRMEDKGDPSILYGLCDDLAAKNMRPKMAGWMAFVSVVPEASPAKQSLKVWQSQSKQTAEVAYAQQAGRKSMQGSQGHPVMVKSFPQLKENARKRKVYYAWDNGVRCLAQGDWTDKT